MKKAKTIIVISCILCISYLGSQLIAQPVTLDGIKQILLENPPNTGDSSLRKQAILGLDSVLISPKARSKEVFDFYAFMMEKVKAEITEEVHKGAKIWIMYNLGFIVKTPDVVFAFDLIDGYADWQNRYSYKLPSEIVSQIKVLFVSHGHDDHSDGSVQLAVRSNGGTVVWGSGEDTMTVEGLNIKIYEGLHSRPTKIYEVTTPNNLKIVHTGDNQTSVTLPKIDSIDVLLLNGWVNENGWESSVVLPIFPQPIQEVLLLLQQQRP